MFIETTALREILRMRSRTRVVQGGTGAGKTIGILQALIDTAQSLDNKLISVVSETFPHLRKGAIRDFLMIMEQHRYFDRRSWNKSESSYTFETGSKIEFFSADQPGKVRGPRRDILFLNEGNNIGYDTYTQLAIRTNDYIFIDYNPVAEFWVHDEIIPKIKHDFIILTYLDNEGLSKNVVEAIESRKGNRNFWRVYGLGLLGEAGGRIYKGWQLIDEISHFARLEGYGLDFGYTNDPTVIVAVYKFNEGFILHEEAYTKGLSNKQIADILLNLPRALVIADSAEPKSIDEIKSYGVNIVPALKGRGSISQGIQYVQDQQISVTKHSTNLIKEYRNYLWETDRDGKTINEPAAIFNHAMDAVRYGLSKYFVDDTPGYNPPDVEKLREVGIKSASGGVGWDPYGLSKGV